MHKGEMKYGKSNCTYFNLNSIRYFMVFTTMVSSEFCMLGVPFILSFEFHTSICGMLISKCYKKFIIQKGG